LSGTPLSWLVQPLSITLTEGAPALVVSLLILRTPLPPTKDAPPLPRIAQFADGEL
jgi:hypothetical protein